MPDTPHWKSTYPIRQSDEHAIARRQFAKVACCSAAAVCAGVLLKDRLFPPPRATAPLRIAAIDDVPIGGSLLFRYPDENHPCILVRAGEHDFAAFSQACTHLMCPVHYQHAQRQFYCPCHEGFFSAQDGRVLAGPPPRPLPRVTLELRGDEIFATGFGVV